MASCVGEGHGACHLDMLSEPNHLSLLPSPLTRDHCNPRRAWCVHRLALVSSGVGPVSLPRPPSAQCPVPRSSSNQHPGKRGEPRRVVFPHALSFRSFSQNPLYNQPVSITLVARAVYPGSVATLWLPLMCHPRCLTIPPLFPSRGSRLI